LIATVAVAAAMALQAPVSRGYSQNADALTACLPASERAGRPYGTDMVV
jgi:hypothetical protein